MTEQVSTRVQVTSFHPAPFGGGILIGRATEHPKSALVRARIPGHLLPRRPGEGEVWRITGVVERHPVTAPGTQRQELLDHIAAVWAAPVAPQGDSIRRWIAKHPDIKGVGEGYAERLWDAFGTRLYDVIKTRDVRALATVLDIPKASSIVEAFGLLLDEISAIEDLDNLGVDGRTANAAIRLFGGDAGRRFREDPYLLSLLEPWSKVDTAALASGIFPSDPRRLLAAVDVAAARAFRTTENNFGGHTVVSRAALQTRVRQMLGRSGAEHAQHAIDLALERGILMEIDPGRYQARAPAHMEREIERSIAERLVRPRQPADRAVIAAVIAQVEREEGFVLGRDQCDAVVMALTSGAAALTGGAGTGKTTIVKAIMRAHQRVRGGDYIQVALSGRAAKRLHEATGGPAMTIYRYLKGVENGRINPRHGLLVVDECSMVSAPDLWLLLAATPPEMDVLFVGDPGQLPPIKAGNPAAVIAASQYLPRVSLQLPHRHAAAAAIPAVADRIREGNLPDLPEFDVTAAAKPGVSLWACEEDDVQSHVLKVFEALAGAPPPSPDQNVVRRIHRADVQILTMTRNGAAGANEIGDAVERRWMASQTKIQDWGFHVGSKFLWTKNSYDHPTGRLDGDGKEEVSDLMNGSIGIFRQQTTAGAEALFDDGTEAELYRQDLDRVLRGWAITVHKAQGSAFQSVIIPVVQCRLLDRAMLYTAITRARINAVLVGRPQLIRQAAATPAIASRRLQALDIDAAICKRRPVT